MERIQRIGSFILGMISLVLVLGLTGCGLVTAASTLLFGSPESEDLSSTLHWIPEESYFVDYEITNRNTVKFRYSICFVNDTDADEVISIYAKFSKKELKDWLKYEKFFAGCDENGEWLYQNIKKGEKINIVFVFEGEYLGGKVNEELSFPDEIIYELSSPEF